MQLTLLIHRGPVVVNGWQRRAANDPVFTAPGATQGPKT